MLIQTVSTLTGQKYDNFHIISAYISSTLDSNSISSTEFGSTSFIEYDEYGNYSIYYTHKSNNFVDLQGVSTITIGTSYLTCESTSGYSGKSSSSKSIEISSWL